MLRLYQSNRLERLSARLAQLLAQAGPFPLQSDVLVVQHPGMGRWLALEIAKVNGICANIRFPLPAAFIWEIFRAFLPDVPLTNRFDPALLGWRILQRLQRLEGLKHNQPLRDYLNVDDPVRSFKLAERLAVLFDRYLVYRPDWIVKWEAGEEAVAGDGWQADLWRDLSAGDELHWVRLQQQLFAYRGERPPNLPERVFLIGLPTLSPGYLQIVQWLAQWSEVHLFLLNPCETYWTEIVDLKEQTRRELRADGSELYLEVGNPLLASLGRQGRDFFAAIQEFDPGSEEFFADPGEHTLLQRLQRQILFLQPAHGEAYSIDDSISFHDCHSPMREAEVLYDQLLAALEAEPALTPADILVMTPDLETYAPLLEAVFAMPGDRPAIPYHISDLPLGGGNPYTSAFMTLLKMPESRYSVNQMLALLEIPAIGRRFGLDEDALDRLTTWIEAANIRWGRDGQSKVELGLPPDAHNTWQAGLERLLLGFAMPSDSSELWQGLAPLNGAEGAAGAWLGGLLSFCEAVFDLPQTLGGSRGISDWCVRLTDMIERFFAADTSAEQPLQQVRNALAQLQETVEAAGFDGEVPLPLLRHWLEQAFCRPTQRGFLAGGVTICALAPMRSLPFQVICLIGMNDGSFPREQPTLSFDLMGRQFRFGDRSRRADDRYLFLETLISARRRLYLSYVGRSVRDNSPLPPSVLVAELRDYLGAQIGESELRRLIRMHPLQPFSSAYFSKDDRLQGMHRLFSYSENTRQAAQLAGQGRAQGRSLITGALPPQTEETPRIGLDQLIDFFTNPARAFARQRLNLTLESGAALLEEREPFDLDRFTGHDLEVELIQALQAGESGQACLQRLEARGVLPHGNPGRRRFEQLLATADGLSGRLRSLQLDEPRQVLDFTLACAEQTLDGRLQGLYPQGRFHFQVSRLYPHQLLALWISHLVLNRLQPEGVAPVSFWLSGVGGGRLLPVAEPQRWLDRLLDCYRQGLRRPLPFYPGTSWAYVQTFVRKADPMAAISAAQAKWLGNDRQPGDRDKPYQRLLYGAGEMLDQEFIDTSLVLLQPLLEHLEETA